MDFEYLLSGLDFRKSHFDHSVEPTRSGEGIVEGILSICSGKDDHGLVTTKTIHLDQQLVESRILFFIP
jgi:hypothetical protein